MKTEDLLKYRSFIYTNRFLAVEQQSLDPKSLIDAIAQYLFNDIHPTTVLDFGCDSGLLVGELRKRGLQAWGVDSSEKTINQTDPEVRPYCRVASLFEPLSQKFDLIVCLETLNGFTTQDAQEIIASICRHTKDILFSSIPYYVEGNPPSRVRAPGYWAAIFSRHGFHHDLDHQPPPFLPWCMRFRKGQILKKESVAYYEDHLWRARRENQLRRAIGVEVHHELALKESQLLGFDQENRAIQGVIETIRSEKEVLQSTIQSLRSESQALQAEIENKQAAIQKLQSEVQDLRVELDQMHSTLLEQRAETQSLQMEIDALRVERDTLHVEKERYYEELASIYSSRSWRFTQFLLRIRRWLIPLDSRRERWVKGVFRFLRGIFGRQ